MSIISILKPTIVGLFAYNVNKLYSPYFILLFKSENLPLNIIENVFV
jgi:hypothetical protein